LFSRRLFDLREVVHREDDLGGGDVLLQPMQLRLAGNRHDPRPLRQQPRERDLRGRRLLFRADLL